VPQTLARHSRSIVEYRVSLGCNFLLASFLLHCPLGEEQLFAELELLEKDIGAVSIDKDVGGLFERRPLPVLTGRL